MNKQNNPRAITFLSAHGMYSGQINLDSTLNDFLGQMTAGLRGEPSSLMMIPAYIGAASDLAGKSAVVLDAGGTNLRAARIQFDEKGSPVISDFSKRPMPGSHTALTIEAFYDALADVLQPFASIDESVGFCFSFPMEILPDREGKILHFVKEIRVSGASGSKIGAGINAALRRRGVKPKKFVMLNDSVATLLYGMQDGAANTYSGFAGFILGTGTNVCYMEQGSEIAKLGDWKKQMIVNVESAGYDGFTQGTFDCELDAASQMPGDHILEKMTSGAYQGGLIYRTVRGAVQEGLFTEGFVNAFDKMPFFTMGEISDYCANPEGSSRIAQLALRGTLADRALLWALVDDSFERSAKMTAVVFAAIAAKMRSGRDPAHPLCMSSEGTTFFKAPLFRPKLNDWLNKWVRDQLGYTIHIIKAENATLIGSAVAALAD